MKYIYSIQRNIKSMRKKMSSVSILKHTNLWKFVHAIFCHMYLKLVTGHSPAAPLCVALLRFVKLVNRHLPNPTSSCFPPIFHHPQFGKKKRLLDRETRCQHKDTSCRSYSQLTDKQWTTTGEYKSDNRNRVTHFSLTHKVLPLSWAPHAVINNKIYGQMW